MTTSHDLPDNDKLTAARVPLRLRLNEDPGKDVLDGGWWPQSRDLATELADLVDNFPTGSGRVMRVLYSSPDWDMRARRVAVARGYVKAGFFPRDDTHLMHLTMTNARPLKLLVIPPAFSPGQGAEALLAAATRGNDRPAAELLDTVTEHADVDPAHEWSREGGGTGPKRATAGPKRR
jgi:hypothetical protein